MFGRPALAVFTTGRADVLFQNVTVYREQVFAQQVKAVWSPELSAY
jgi:hypothetical protein